jgi:hypothetical protein
MSKRQEHTFQFTAEAIAKAAGEEADYHEARVAYWQGELEAAYATVERTMGARIEKQHVTNGWRPEVTIDYGDPAAYRRMGEAAAKVQTHQQEAERFRTDQRLYATQGERVYELATADVHHYRLGGGPRDE